MAEYINRDELYEIESLLDSDIIRQDATASYLLGQVLYDIKAFPASDVAPVRHGRWEAGNPVCPVCGENKFKDLDADIWADWTPKYCPNCGSFMLEDKP